MVKALITEPDPMTSLPNSSDISPPMAQERALNALTCLPDRFDSDLTSPNEITHRFMALVGNPYGGEFASPREPRQLNRIASGSLDAIASTPWRVRRRDDSTDMACVVDLPIQTVTAGACFLDHVQLAIPLGNPLQRRGNGIRSVADPAVETHIARSSVGNGDGNRVLVDIEAEIGIKVHWSVSLCMRIGAESA